MTNIVKDMFLFATENTQRTAPCREKKLTLKKPVRIFKKKKKY